MFRDADLGIGRCDTENFTVIGRPALIVQADVCAAVEPQDVAQMMKLRPAELSPTPDDGPG